MRYDFKLKLQSAQWRHTTFLAQDQTNNREYYLWVLRNLREVIRKNHPELWRYNYLHFTACSWILCLEQHHHAPSPILAGHGSVRFFFFKTEENLKESLLSEHRWGKKNVVDRLEVISNSDFRRFFGDWKKHWRKNVMSNWNYFKEYNIDVDE